MIQTHPINSLLKVKTRLIGLLCEVSKNTAKAAHPENNKVVIKDLN